jgi:signal transduction histidine kinase
VVTVAALAVAMLRLPVIGSAANIPFTLVPLTAVLVAGRVLRHRHEQQAVVAARAERLEADAAVLAAEREAHVAAALDAERNRIARELHDIVAHCVSVMVVQAGASEALLDHAPDRAREPLRAVQETGRQAVAELGRMLGLLRGSPQRGGALALAPQPGTSQLPELVERMCGLGLGVQFVVSGDVRPLAPGVDVTAYRIVQEALTNTLKHAGPDAKAHVELRYLARTLEVEVTDDGRAPAAPTGTGNGLIGMTERAAIYGGVLDARARPEGGFRVSVSLPVEAA